MANEESRRGKPDGLKTGPEGVIKDRSHFYTDMREFGELSPLEKLRTSFRVTVNPEISIEEKRVLRSKAIVSALEMDPLDRNEQGIRIVAIGELNQKGRVVSQFPEWSNYSVFAVFPTDKGVNRFIASSNKNLQEELSENAFIDQVVNYQADAIREETLFEKQRRLIFEIKAIDTAIAFRIASPVDSRLQSIEELNSWKNRKILEYLFTSLDLQEENPDMEMDFFQVNKDPTGKTRINLKRTLDHAMRARLEVASTDSNLDLDAKEFSTGVDVNKLLSAHKQYVTDPSSVSDSVEINAGICRILQLDRENDHDEEGIFVEVEVQEEASEIELDEVASESGTVVYTSQIRQDKKQPLTKAAKKRMRKKQVKTRNWIPTQDGSPPDSEDNAVVIGSPSLSSPDQQFEVLSYSELASVHGIAAPMSAEDVKDIDSAVALLDSKDDSTILDDLRYYAYVEGNVSSERRTKVNMLIRKILKLSPEERKDLGLYVVVSGQIDPYEPYPNVAQYQVHVLFSSGTSVDVLSTDRRNLSRVMTASYMDRLIGGLERVDESPIDRYARFYAEVSTIEGVIEEQKKMADTYSYRVMGDVPGREEKEREAREKIKAYSEFRRALLLQCLQSAVSLQDQYGLSPLFYYREGANRESGYVGVRKVDEVKKAQRLVGLDISPELQVGEYLPEVFITLKRATMHSAGHTVDSQDKLLSDLLLGTSAVRLQSYEADMPPELRNFVALSLEEKLKVVNRDLARSKDIAREGVDEGLKRLTIMEQRIFMRDILEATPEEKERLGIDIIVVGPAQNGRIVLTGDPDLTAYNIYVLYPHEHIKGSKFYLPSSRRFLARNPYTDAYPTLEELFRLDRVVNASGAEIRSELDDPAIAFNLQIDAIMHAENRIKAIRDEDSGRDQEARIDQVNIRKLPYILSFLSLALSLQEQYNLGHLFELASRGTARHPDIMDLVMFPIVDLTEKDYLNGVISVSERRLKRDRAPRITLLNSRDLLIAKKDYDSGKNTSQTAEISAAICEILGRDDIVVR